MAKRTWLALVVVGLVLGSGWVWAQDAKDPKKEEPPTQRLRGQLPANYKKLGLNDDQVQKIYRIQADYQGKVKELEDQIKKLKTQEKGDIEKVLTKAQRERLKEILTGEEKKGDDKKEDK